MKLIESPEEGLTSLSRQTLKYLHWVVRKIITTIEVNPHGLVWYELQPKGENRNSDDPTPALEANLMFKLERSMFLFDFEPSPPLLEKGFIITDRNSSANFLEILINDLKNDPDPERKYKRGWLVNYNLDSLKEHLEAIEKHLADKEMVKTVLAYSNVPSKWGWFDKKAGEYQFGSKGIFTQGGDKVRKKVFQALIDIFEESPQGVSVASVSQRTGIKPERLRIEIDAINTRLSKQIGIYFKGTGKGYYMIENYSPTKSSSI